MVPAAPLAADPGARRSLVARLTAGPLARGVARWDLRLYRGLRGAARGPAVPYVQVFSRAGEHAGVWLVIGGVGYLIDPERRPQWRRGLLAVLGVYVLNVAIKNVVRRKRPLLADLPALISTPTSLSFPSAHASSSFAAARAYGTLLPSGGGWALHSLAAAMAVSRVYLGVHYPSDIAVGAALGTIVGSAAR